MLFGCAFDRGIACVPCSGRQLWAVLLALFFFLLWGVGRRALRTSRGLLLAEALHALGGHVGRLWNVRAVSTGGRGRFGCRRWVEVTRRCCMSKFSGRTDPLSL